MSEDVKNNIIAAFEANESATEFYYDANGHCFTHGGVGLTAITREEIFGAAKESTKKSKTK